VGVGKAEEGKGDKAEEAEGEDFMGFGIEILESRRKEGEKEAEKKADVAQLNDLHQGPTTVGGL